MKPTVIILSISSDIGFDLAKRYLKAGYNVIGTYRKHRKDFSDINTGGSCQMFQCDVHRKGNVEKFVRKLTARKIVWETFISCVGEPRPLTGFFQSDFDDWSRSTAINSTDQLRVLHLLYPLRNKEKKAKVIFFAGGGVNKPVVNFSAYTIGKIMLIKMCEYLDAENDDLNIFIIGPGWTKTKNHLLILKDPHISPEKYRETMHFLQYGKGTSTRYIYECIRWLCSKGREVAGGRNFSLAYDPLKPGQRIHLAQALQKDKNMYKLRRSESGFKI